MATSLRSDLRSGDGVPGAGWGAIGALLRRPHRGWRRIERARSSVGGLFVGVAMPLAAIGPIAGAIHDLSFGHGAMGIIQYRPTLVGAVTTAVVGWVASLVLLAMLAAAIGALGRRLGGSGDGVAAMKAAIFGSSAFFLAAGFAVLPVVTFLQLLGLYSLFLLAAGTPRLMKVADERAVTLSVGAAGLAIVLVAALFVLDGWVAKRSLRPTIQSAGHRVVVRDAPAIAGAKLTAPATSKKNAPPPGTAAAAAAVVPASSLQALLPTGVEGFTRTGVESQTSVNGGVASARADGTYIADTNSFTLTITDAGGPDALATTNSVIAGELNRTTDSGYQRSQVVNGVRTTEKWSDADHGGSYSRTVGGRFTIEARGTAPGIGTLRAAVASVDARRLAALGR